LALASVCLCQAQAADADARRCQREALRELALREGTLEAEEILPVQVSDWLALCIDIILDVCLIPYIYFEV
jgi:hypothetical protein